MASTSPPFSIASVAGLLVAAGGGTRLGGRPKAFLRHRGRTMLEHGADYLGLVAARLIVGLPADRLDEGRALLAGTAAQCLAGGGSKKETSRILLDQSREDVVLVHDVSQFMPAPELLHQVLAALDDADAAAPCVRLPVRGALATRDDEGRMTAVLDRDNAVMSHTPQAYRRQALVAALDRAGREGWTESGLYALVHRNGGRVRLIDGDPDQLKLTYPQDLAVLEPA
jgi:2-C-methyl-D-erythritol 4-phosphate cytidylyltransferase